MPTWLASGTRFHIIPLKRSFVFYVRPSGILINSLVYINHCTQEEWLHLHPMKDHLYPYKSWFHLIYSVGTSTTDFDFSDNSHDSQRVPSLFWWWPIHLYFYYRIFWTVSSFQGWKSFWISITTNGGVIQVVFSYWLLEYFFQHQLFPLRKTSLCNSNHTCKLHSICRKLVDLLPLSPAFGVAFTIFG